MAENESIASAAISESRLTQLAYGGAQESRSFTSPYAAETLDQIPTPILRFLVVLGPAIRRFAQCVEIVTWSTPYPRQSILAVLLWIICCLWTSYVLTLVVPGLVLVKIAGDWLTVQTARSRREKLEKERAAQRKLQKAREDDDDYYDDDDSQRMRQQQNKQQQEEEEELVSRKFQPEGQVSLDDTLQDLAAIDRHMDRVRQGIKWLAENANGSRPEVLISILTLLLYAWPIWIVLNWIMGPSGVLALVGSLALTCQSPWFKVGVLALRQNVILMHLIATVWAYGVACVVSIVGTFLPLGPRMAKKAGSKSKSARVKEWVFKTIRLARDNKSKALAGLKIDETDAKGTTRKEMVFQFEVYENQRWWLGMDWTTNMMPNERGPWTDSQLAPIPSKESFELPASTQTVEEDFTKGSTRLVKKIITKTWSWADGDWWVDMTGELQGRVDRNGWEYGNNAWKQMSGKPDMNTFTRRRRWCRRARLVERQIQDPMSKKND